MKTKKPPMPTEAQSRTLRMIAQNGGLLCLTRDAEDLRYHTTNGITVPAPTAARLIRCGWVTPQRDSMFDLEPQTWAVKGAA
jgi:hypothetical protein